MKRYLNRAVKILPYIFVFTIYLTGVSIYEFTWIMENDMCATACGNIKNYQTWHLPLPIKHIDFISWDTGEVVGEKILYLNIRLNMLFLFVAMFISISLGIIFKRTVKTVCKIQNIMFVI